MVVEVLQPHKKRWPQGLRGIDPEEGRYDFDGKCVRLAVPDRPRNWGRWRDLDIVGTLPRQQTFSLGVYRYVSKTDGGLKRGPVVARFPGSFAENPRVAFENAEAKCRELEER